MLSTQKDEEKNIFIDNLLPIMYIHFLFTKLNKWNQVGASYDSNTGVAQLWHDGKMVKSRNIGQVDLATDQNIRLGACDNDERYFEGKMSCLQIYDRALKEKEIGELRVCPKFSNKDGNKDKSNKTVEEEGIKYLSISIPIKKFH